SQRSAVSCQRSVPASRISLPNPSATLPSDDLPRLTSRFSRPLRVPSCSFVDQAMPVDVAAINERVQAQSSFVSAVKSEVAKVIVGQDVLVERLLIAMLCRGHILIEGVPGLAKTLTVSTLARAIDASFVRIQFTPDMLPADVTGTTIYSPQDSQFHIRKGPVFANIVLADEINRAPA